MTFLEQQTRVGELINQRVTDDTKTVKLTTVKAWLNIGYQKQVNAISAIDEEYFLRWTTANLVANQKYYSFPSDFRKLDTLELGYEGSSVLYKSTLMDRNSIENSTTTFSTASPVHYIIGDMYEINPTPSSNVTGGIRMLYIEAPTDLSSDGDVPKTPLGYHYMPVLYAASKAKQQLGLKTEAEAYMAEFFADIEIMIEDISNRADGNDRIIIEDMYQEV